MDKLITFWEQLLETIPLMAVALLGCVIQWVKAGHPGGFKNLLISSATAGFGSLCVGFLFSSFPQIPMGVTLFFCGMIGYSGGSLVDFMLQVTKDKAQDVVKRYGVKETSTSKDDSTVTTNTKNNLMGKFEEEDEEEF